jgi:hypothetical protein
VIDMASVYAIVVDGVIRYGGKGSGKRHLDHMRIVQRGTHHGAALLPDKHRATRVGVGGPYVPECVYHGSGKHFLRRL